MATRLGLGIPQMKHYHIGRDIPDVARAVERTGYDSLWVFERVLFPDTPQQGLYNVPGLPWPDSYRSVADPLVSLTLAAAATEHARLGTSVLVAPLHVPLQLARTLASLDAASGGRLVAGLGTGWSLDEYGAAAVAPFEERGQVLDELIEVCRGVWGPDPVILDGKLTTLAPSEVGPKPAGPLPILLPAGSRRAARRLVDHADGWMPVALGAEKLAEDWAKLQELAAERGRTKPLEVVVRVNAACTDEPYTGADRRPFQGSIPQLVEDLAAHVEATNLPEFAFDLQDATGDASQLKDRALELYEAVRAAGL